MTRLTTIFFVTFLAFLFVSGLSTQVIADDICACYHKTNGKLRIVSDHDECKPSEVPITLATSTGSQNVEFQCVTGELFYNPSDPPIYCDDEYSLKITSPYSTDIDPYDVFEVYCESPSPYSNDEVFWGLRCKEGWTNTGCTGSSFDVSGEVDIPQFLNGCHSDNEEYGHANIFTTCCKIIVTTEKK